MWAFNPPAHVENYGTREAAVGCQHPLAEAQLGTTVNPHAHACARPRPHDRDRDTTPTATHDREVDPKVLKIRTADECPKEALSATLRPLLQRARVEEQQVRLDGPQLGRNFTIAFCGSAQLAARHAGMVHSAQRGEDGTWTKLQAIAISWPLST